MLFIPPCGFGVTEYNWTDTNFNESTFGEALTTGAVNTKGSDTALSLFPSFDVYGVGVGFCNGNSVGAVRQYLVDVKVDRAGGTTWSTLIPNLIVNSPSLFRGGYWYYFPLYLPAGTAFAAAAQCNAGTQTIDIGIILMEKPTRPDLVKAGSFVRAFGPNTGTSGGASITPEQNAKGLYTASLGTTADDLWWWQGGLAINDSTQVECAYAIDVACGDATNKIFCVRDMWMWNGNTNERSGKSAFGGWPMQPIPSGANVYMRAAATGNGPDGSVTAAAYGLGG